MRGTWKSWTDAAVVELLQILSAAKCKFFNGLCYYKNCVKNYLHECSRSCDNQIYGINWNT